MIYAIRDGRYELRIEAQNKRSAIAQQKWFRDNDKYLTIEQARSYGLLSIRVIKHG